MKQKKKRQNISLTFIMVDNFMTVKQLSNNKSHWLISPPPPFPTQLLDNTGHNRKNIMSFFNPLPSIKTSLLYYNNAKHVKYRIYNPLPIP